MCGSLAPALCRPYLAIQLSSARGRIFEWAARGAMLKDTASSISGQVKLGLGHLKHYKNRKNMEVSVFTMCKELVQLNLFYAKRLI